jgi:hypothetical protein
MKSCLCGFFVLSNLYFLLVFCAVHVSSFYAGDSTNGVYLFFIPGTTEYLQLRDFAPFQFIYILF